MKKIILISFMIFSITLSLNALESLNGNILDQGDFFGITFEYSFGYLTGEAREIVYLDDDNSSYLSELIWDLTDIFYTGGVISVNFKNRLYVNAGAWTAVHQGTGFMNDFDWYNLTGTSYPTYDDNGRSGWTHWSLSEVDIIDSLIVDVNLSFDFLPIKDFGLSAIGGYKYVFWDWTDSVLDSLYPSGPDVLEVGSDAIDYQLGLHVPYFGLGAEWFSEMGFHLQSRFIYSPLVMGSDHDHHIQRLDYGPGGIHFYDYIYFGQYISGSLKVGYLFSENFAMMAQFSGEYLFETRGSTYVYDNDGDYQGVITNGAGIQYQSLSISLNWQFSF